jgi:glycosyltransferase involved in cell wall biosynthesis
MKRHSPIRVAYLMSRFPKLTETFVLYEMLELQRQGCLVEVYPLLHERTATMHPEAKELVERAHYQPFLSRAIVGANWRRFRRAPIRYLRLWFEVLYHTMGSINFFFGALGILPKSVLFAEDIERLGVTHVHAHFANHPALAALIGHRLTGLPYSFTAHGSDLHVERRMLDRKLESAAFAIAVSSYNKELMIRECGDHLRSKIHVVHCGVDTALLRASSARETAEGLRILCVGSLSEVKGQRYLVEACQLLQREGIEFRCSLVGEGPLRRRLRRQIRQAGLTERIHLLGASPRPEILRLLDESDVLVLPSVPTRAGKREGIPLALMEAMATGLPVVASNLSGIPELVRSGVSGFLVAPGDFRGIAKALRVLAKDAALRRQIGQAGRRTVLEEFDLRKNTAVLRELFRGSATAPAAISDVAHPRHSREVTHELQTG